MKTFIYRNIYVKGFFSETSILGANFWPQKWQKGHISERSENSEKLKKLDPHFNFWGGYTSSTSSNSNSLQRCVFGHLKVGQFALKILVSEKNPFTQKFLYMKVFIWPGIDILLRICYQPYWSRIHISFYNSHSVI